MDLAPFLAAYFAGHPASAVAAALSAGMITTQQVRDAEFALRVGASRYAVSSRIATYPRITQEPEG